MEYDAVIVGGRDLLLVRRGSITMSVQAEPSPSWETSRRAIEAFARTVTIGALTGFVAGLIAGGVGSRLAMRISGILTEPAFRRVLTENDNVVGEITVGGTFFLVFFGGFIGVFGGLAYAAMRPWVAGARRWRGLTFGALLLAIFGWGLIEGDNPDFHLFGPPVLNIVMFASLFVLFGLLVAPIFEWTQRTLPSPSFRRRFGLLPLPIDYSPWRIGSLGAQGFGLFLAVMIVVAAVGVGFGEDGDNRDFRALPAYVLLVLPIASVLCARAAGRFQRLSDLGPHRGALTAALVVLMLPVIAGVVLNVRAIAEIVRSA